MFRYLLLLTYWFIVSCGGGIGGESPNGDPPPSWLTNIPQENATLCAVGVSGPTYYPEEAMVNSKTQAMSELGRSLKSQVSSRMLVQEHGGQVHHSDVEIDDAIALSSDEILEMAEVKSRWVNPGGYSAQGTKGTVYTLMCISR